MTETINETMRSLDQHRGEELYLELEEDEDWRRTFPHACAEIAPGGRGTCHRPKGHTGLHAWLYNWKDHRPGRVSTIWLTERNV